MVTKPEVGLQAGLQAAQLELQGAGLGMQNAENQYQSGVNQYKANQLQGQQNQQLAMQLGQTGLDAFNSFAKGQYLNSLTPSMQAKSATLGAIPAYTNSSYLDSLGFQPGETPSFGTGA
jgi:hypothetical protein